MVVLLTVALALAVVLLGIVAMGAVVGEFGALSGTELRRCERCQRIGLVSHEGTHPGRCPTPLLDGSMTADRLPLGRRLGASIGEHAHAPRHVA